MNLKNAIDQVKIYKNTHIHCLILHHDLSAEYTRNLTTNLLPSDYTIYDASKENTPFTLSWNRSVERWIKASNKDWVMVCNNDISLTQSQLNKLSSFIAKQSPAIFSPLVTSGHRHMMESYGNSLLREEKWIEFVCPIIHRKVIEDVGFLDESFTLGYGIDFDYCYRARQQQYKIYLMQQSKIRHYEHKSQKDHLSYRKKATREMSDGMIRKYGENWRFILT